jgi:hypothetical protein
MDGDVFHEAVMSIGLLPLLLPKRSLCSALLFPDCPELGYRQAESKYDRYQECDFGADVRNEEY